MTDGALTASDRNRHFFDTLARWGKPGDVWMQVGRAAGTAQIDAGQVDLLVHGIRTALALEPHDVLLDLACGNGALSRRLFDGCAAGHGIDFSEPMIAACAAGDDPRYTFALADIESFVHRAPDAGRYTKGCCAFAFQYLSPEAAHDALATLRKRFTALRALYVGDMPDRTRIDACDLAGFKPQADEGFESPFGLWRTPAEFEQLARDAGWNARLLQTDPAYYAAHYRFEMVLAPR